MTISSVLFSGGMPPDPQGSLREAMGKEMFQSYSMKPRRAMEPPAYPNPDVAFSGGTPPDFLGSLRSRLWVKTCFSLFVEASQSHGADDAECDDHEDVGDDNDDSDTNDIDENNGHGTDQVRAENPVDDSRDKLRRRITQILWDTDNS
ncbi:hypothetical protein TRICI_003180 [Trichomonascus ciferrii]|uniref:Uncharacterized protein n=1 Tax=Trichomonascus ciferrii TaxID=44093 RepID=A0A642V4P7_9ASCO|nr:hypothetical protein TRICI_003180 [Trichomonascus ciferrii]